MFSLRPVTPDDLGLILKWRNQPEIREKMYTTHVISETEHRAYFERIKDDATKLYFMCIDEQEQPVGVINFMDIDTKNRMAFWGFYSGNSARRGVGTQMEYLALSYAFDEMNLHKLNAEVLSTNKPVLDFHQKFGFQLEGTFREHHLTPEGYVDIYRIAILQQDWEQAWREKARSRLDKALKPN
jgi:UDP-4-amino-4,6-dideoxy-N-acetyl-beta-L-altrosamine N-acetyltransferase